MLLLLEVLNPFYIFQAFTLSVWFAEGYYYYNIAIVLMSLFGITSTIVQTRKVYVAHDIKREIRRIYSLFVTKYIQIGIVIYF